MPPIAGVKVSNVYVRFVSGAPGVVADPIKAHSGPPKDPRFWKILLEGAGTKRVEKMVPRDGIEPPTLRFSVACSTN